MSDNPTIKLAFDFDDDTAEVEIEFRFSENFEDHMPAPGFVQAVAQLIMSELY